MKALERFILFLIPSLRLKGTPWENIWVQQRKAEWIQTVKFFYIIAIFSYISHYFTIDRAEGLSPSALWFNYRFGMSLICGLALLFYSFEPLYRYNWYKLPMIVTTSILIYFQNETIIWYPKVPYLYSFLFILISVIVFGESIIYSLAYALFNMMLIMPTLVKSGVSSSMISSACIMTLMLVIFIRSSFASEIRLFISTQRHLETQKQIIEMNTEFTDQIKSFLPLQISLRMMHFIKEERMNSIQAIYEVLRPQKKKIGCLFSDIRGFTKSSNDLDGFVSKSLLPNIRSATAAVERFDGIPRKIGDLILSYFDSDDFTENIKQTLRAAIEVRNINMEHNKDLPKELKIIRFILISAGDAIVGNLSGYDSSIEISAIGQPINLLSRIDEITKQESIRNLLSEGDIIMDPIFLKSALEIYPTLDYILLPINYINIQIRNFENIKDLYILPVSKKNYQLIFKDTPMSDDSERGIA